MAWDKIGNPANPKQCGKCCGVDTSFRDPSPCSPQQKGIYPNAGASKIYLSVEWERFTPIQAGFFDVDKMRKEIYGDANATFPADSFTWVPSPGLPANYTLDYLPIAIDPFVVELDLQESASINTCEFSTPEIQGAAIGGPGVDIAGAEASVAAAGYLEVQSAPAFDDFVQVGQSRNQITFGIGSTTETTYNFGKLYATATLSLSNDQPSFTVRILQVSAQHSVETSEEDGTEVRNQAFTLFEPIFELTDYFHVDSHPSANEQYHKNFNCVDFPVFVGDERLDFAQPETMSRIAGLESVTFDGTRGVRVTQGLPYMRANFASGPRASLLSTGHINTPTLTLPGDVGFSQPQNESEGWGPVSNWPNGWVRPHPEHDPAGSPPSVVSVFHGPAVISDWGADETEDVEEPFSGDTITVPVGPAHLLGSNRSAIYHLGMRNLTVRLLTPGAVIA